ncbi:MAG TPA: response regulator [Ignavibacteriaceae bacterium]|nr:response regulator [Ignavibacteriaceae bacterium]
MKISLRILLINFLIVVVIITSAAVAFYSLMYNVISQKQSEQLLYSVNNFTFRFNEEIQSTDEAFGEFLKKNSSSFLPDDLDGEKKLDFILKTSGKQSFEVIDKTGKKDLLSLLNNNDLKSFFNQNPHLLIREFQAQNGSYYYYGRAINAEFLTQLAKKINSEIAFVINNSTIEISNAPANLNHTFALNEAYLNLSTKSNFEIYHSEKDKSDLLVTIYRANILYNPNKKVEFLIFSSLSAATSLSDNIKEVLMIIGLSGIVLSLILTLLFTSKLRRQITELSEATEKTKRGDFKNKIKIKSTDEIGKLGEAFNLMLDELEKNQRAKNEYSEFISLINQNPTLSEITDAALKKIVGTCHFTTGALFTVEDDTLHLKSSHGINPEQININKNINFYKPVIERKETLEINSSDLLPIVETGIFKIEIKNLLVLPVIYNNNVIAVLELGSVDKPSSEAKEYLSKIQEQLAIGITNANALVQLENFIAELKQLNVDYQQQNIQVRKQNESLLELHQRLKEKADELAIQKQKAEESTQLKSQFLASMSHELRTPMNSILGLTELIIEKSSLDDKNKERLQVVYKSGKRLMNLINDILDLSKIEAGKMELREEDVLLEEILEEVETTINPLVTEKSLEFNIIRDTNTRILVNTDRGKITQVLINLLGNAIKFTHQGSIELKISTTVEKMLQFDVKDTGIGISEENQKIIFEEFRQIDGSTTRRYGGTGLGLAITKKIIELLKGKIWLKSESERGSTFSFTVPLIPAQAKTLTAEVQVNINTLIKNRSNPILVIDDDPEVRYTIGQYLISKGYSVEYAENSDDGIKKAIELQPFAITLDIMMPDKDGWTVMKELKENEETKDIPVILISITGDKNLGYGLGAFEFFIKPLSADKLLSALGRLEMLAHKSIQKVVIVDDDELEFEKFKREFKNDNIRIEYIQDSEFAFNKIAEVQPDLIIVDLMMPKIDGITLSHKLKSSSKTKHIPIIISTAKDISDEEKKSLSNIVDDITIKSKGHPLDVLKVVRDRIKLQEISYLNESSYSTAPKSDSPKIVETKSKEDENSSPRGEIVIVDDDPDTLFTINEIVRSLNFKTKLARSGMECLQILQKQTPDLILLDIMMPAMDGFQTLKNIKANDKWKSIPVYAVTAKAMTGDKEIIIKSGFDDYIPKPVNSAIISFKIEQLLLKIKS